MWEICGFFFFFRLSSPMWLNTLYLKTPRRWNMSGKEWRRRRKNEKYFRKCTTIIFAQTKEYWAKDEYKTCHVLRIEKQIAFSKSCKFVYSPQFLFFAFWNTPYGTCRRIFILSHAQLEGFLLKKSSQKTSSVIYPAASCLWPWAPWIRQSPAGRLCCGRT